MPASAPDRPPQIVIRADGSASIGLGHVMRSLTLARALCRSRLHGPFRRGRCSRASHDRSSEQLQVAEHSKCREMRATLRRWRPTKPDLVVVDGYHFTAEFFEALEDAGIAVRSDR